jgi:hypothetical protein
VYYHRRKVNLSDGTNLRRGWDSWIHECQFIEDHMRSQNHNLSLVG